MPGAYLPQHHAAATAHPTPRQDLFSGVTVREHAYNPFDSGVCHDDHYKEQADTRQHGATRSCAFCERMSDDGQHWYEPSGYEGVHHIHAHAVCPSCRSRFGG